MNEDIVYEMRKNSITGIMNIENNNESTATTALIYQYKTYDHYVRILDLKYMNTDLRREYNLYRLLTGYNLYRLLTGYNLYRLLTGYNL